MVSLYCVPLCEAPVFIRRICPGMWTADASLFIVMAGVLATFEVKSPLDEDGKEVLPQVKYTTGMIRWDQRGFIFYSINADGHC